MFVIFGLTYYLDKLRNFSNKCHWHKHIWKQGPWTLRKPVTQPAGAEAHDGPVHERAASLMGEVCGGGTCMFHRGQGGPQAHSGGEGNLCVWACQYPRPGVGRSTSEHPCHLPQQASCNPDHWGPPFSTQLSAYGR